MALSNKFGGMVVATGNKSEMAVGYATLYGDMAGGYAVLKDVFKTLVYRLAEWRNRDGEVIPRAIIDKAPSAELRARSEGQRLAARLRRCSTRSCAATSSSTNPSTKSSPTGSDAAAGRAGWLGWSIATSTSGARPPPGCGSPTRPSARTAGSRSRTGFRCEALHRRRADRRRGRGAGRRRGIDLRHRATRGYGCFEALRSYGGRPFRLDAHLDRLEASARKLFIDLPDRPTLQTWVRDRAAQAGDCVVRVLVTGGTSLTKPGTESRILVIAEPIPLVPFSLRVLPLPAPWHSDRTDWTLTGAKTLSYAPNVAATLAARAEGYNDALLIGADEIVLEGPTYCIGWVRDGVIETPSLDVGILASITRSAVIEVAHRLELQVTQRAYRLGRLMEADEAFVMSTVKQILPVIAVGQQELPAGPITRRLVEGFASLVAAETGG